jgi:elongation factor Tu
MVICKPGSVKPHATFKAEVLYLESFVHYVGVTEFIITLPEGVEMVMPGDNLTIDVVLLSAIALSVGLRSIREGGRTVGAGQVTEIVA